MRKVRQFRTTHKPLYIIVIVIVIVIVILFICP